MHEQQPVSPGESGGGIHLVRAAAPRMNQHHVGPSAAQRLQPGLAAGLGDDDLDAQIHGNLGNEPGGRLPVGEDWDDD